MTYTPEKPPIAASSDELRARIPGWGVDLDPADRPAVPKERFDPSLSGAHWVHPDRQPERWPRERSVEHTQLPPVFGTACPPRGLSGMLRKLSYARYSEGQSAHWLLLIAADRVDTVESALRSLLTARPDNPLTQTGLRAEVTATGCGPGSATAGPTSSTTGWTPSWSGRRGSWPGGGPPASYDGCGRPGARSGRLPEPTPGTGPVVLVRAGGAGPRRARGGAAEAAREGQVAGGWWAERGQVVGAEGIEPPTTSL